MLFWEEVVKGSRGDCGPQTLVRGCKWVPGGCVGEPGTQLGPQNLAASSGSGAGTCQYWGHPP